MQHFGQVFFVLGIIFAVLTAIGFKHPWLPVGLAVIALEVSASAFKQFSFIGVAKRTLIRTSPSRLWKTHG